MKKNHRRIVSCALVWLLGISTQAQADDVAVLYEGTNFTGASWSLPVGEYTITDFFASPIGNDALSSLTVTNGFAIEVCRHNQQREDNDCEIFESSSASLGSLNNAASSLRVFAQDVAVLYEGANFTGASWSLPVGEYDIAEINASSIGNDALSSLTVASGFSVELCLHNQQREDNVCEVFQSSSASLGSLNNNASSLTVFAQPDASGPLGDALDTLVRHLDGIDVLTTAELYELRDTIEDLSAADTLVGNAALVQKAYSVIQNYESVHGALFTSDGTQSFKLSDSDTDGRELERTINIVYLAVFDAIDAELIESNPALLDGLAFGSADYFPGSVSPPANANVVYETQIDASVPLDWGRPNLYSRSPARRPTGAYLAAGSIAEVTVPSALVNSGFQILVGAHTWDLSSRPDQKRIGRVSKRYPITSATTLIANPVGGNIYIEVPHLADAGMVSIELKNTVRAPYFSARSFDQITAGQWDNTERNQPGSWTDIETDKVMMSVPSKWIRDFDFDDLTEILDNYDAHLDLISDYMGKPRIRNKPFLFMQVDVIFRGVAFFPGYPMSNYPNFDSPTPRSPLVLGHAFDQTMLHEHGHATYMTKFSRETESAVHMLYPYIATQRYGMPLEEAFSSSLHYARSTERTMDDVFVSWALRDQFLNDIEMGHEESAYKHRGHADYIQYADLFGWNALTEFNRNLNVDFVESGFDFDRNNHNRNDRLLRLSREAGADVRPLFHLWGHSASDDIALQASIDFENLQPSAAIYDQMVDFKSTIPFTQADYDAWYARMSAVLFSGHRFDFWDPLAASYDTQRAQDAVDRIDELLALYFPDGRPPVNTVQPADPPAPIPVPVERTDPIESPNPVPVDPVQPVDPPNPIPVDPSQPISLFNPDTDLDGVPDTIELAENTDPSDASSFLDSDSDGIPDIKDADSDGDGQLNLFEAGALPYYDRDRDGVPAYLDDNDYNNQIGNDDNAVESLFDPNNDGIAEFANPSIDAVDSDQDGVPDSVEIVDGTDASDASSFLDNDNDTIPDYIDEDDDNDGILDMIEGSGDADQDGIANQFDTDSDGDGVSDSEEGYADLNGDALPNFLDPSTNTLTAVPDQDNDGISDDIETTDDADQDGTANHLDTDSDSDRLGDFDETNADFDADGVPNFLDDDSDADGISDSLEGLSDADNDSLSNAIDYDSDADLIPDSVELASDYDEDGIPNFLDSDSDGDGVSDLLETARDADGNGAPDFLDNDDLTPITTTGSGCSTGSGNGSIDPLLFMLLAISATVLLRRRRI